jgi:hypothetical protein
LAAANDLPDVIITTESGLKITPLDSAVPDTAQTLIDQTAMLLQHVKIAELLLEVDEWTGFTRHFLHLKSGDVTKDKTLLFKITWVLVPLDFKPLLLIRTRCQKKSLSNKKSEIQKDFAFFSNLYQYCGATFKKGISYLHQYCGAA